jgi:CheY-like chemotaxis protein
MGDHLSILAVDDNRGAVGVLAEILDFKGYEVFTAYSGAEALQILDRHAIDLLLTDVKMPEMNGVELYRETRKSHPNLPTILMTAYTADDLIQEAMTEGIRSVMTKPVDIDLLLTLLSAI